MVIKMGLIGPFLLSAQDGSRINIPSKKGQALLAMLAVSGSGERTRSWLQNQLWGTRATDQAQASLRNELSTLKAVLNYDNQSVISSDKNTVRLNLSLIQVDVRADEVRNNGEFLEGIDIADEEGFEEWLREERANLRTRAITQKDLVNELSCAPISPANSEKFSKLPALAVLPFANLTGDPAYDYFSEGLSEDLIDQLSRLRWLPVIARGSSFGIREADPDLRRVGNLLSARYIVEGRLRRQGNKQLLLASLGDSETGQILWSSRLEAEDLAAPDAFNTLITGLAATLGTRVDQEEQARTLQRPHNDLNVRELIWRGRWHANRMTKEDAVKAKACFAQSLILDPNSPEALIQSLTATLWELWAERRKETEIRDIRQKAQRAIIADLDDARGYMIAGIAECWLRQPIRAEKLLRQAIALNPSLVLAYAELGSVLYLDDRPEEAIEVLNFAIRLSPNDHSLFYSLGELAMCHLMIGNYDLAAELADSAITRRTAYWYSHIIKINALARNGNLLHARNALSDLMVSKIHFKENFINWLPFVNSQWNDFLKEGLNLADG